MSKQTRALRIAIIGAGPGGLCMASQLREAGFRDFVLLEKAGGIGGTWYHNRYPGCACDVPSALYSFSFALKSDWSRPYAPQPEIRAYMEDFAARHELLPHCRFDSEVRSATWQEDSACWQLTLGSGEEVEAEIVVSALGMFNEPSWPEIPGLADFEGTKFHSARWDESHDLAGETVGVIGSAASAVQLVPEIVKEARQVHLYQRTPNWVLPKEDDPLTEEQLQLFRENPDLVATLRQAIFQPVDEGMTFSDPQAVADSEASGLEAMAVVEDPEVRERLRPDHPFGCKRPLFSNDYYAAFNRPNLELVTDPIERISEDSVITRDGRARRADTLILATGFAATRYLSAIDVTGRDGLGIAEAWRDGAQAYLGITTSGFPNLFMIYGPNTNNGSILTMIEAQVDYIVRKLAWIQEEGLAWIDVRREPMERYNEEVQQAIEGVQVWQAGCPGYYRTPSGRVVTQWPYSMSEFQERTRKADEALFEVAAR